MFGFSARCNIHILTIHSFVALLGFECTQDDNVQLDKGFIELSSCAHSNPTRATIYITLKQ